MGKERADKSYQLYEKIILDINIAIANIKCLNEIQQNKNQLRKSLFILESLELAQLSSHYKDLLLKYNISL